jgi:replicative DNA helicase
MRRKTHTHIRDIVPDVLGKFYNGEPVTDAADWVMTGIPALDRKIGGFRKGYLITIAGRPSTGKTTVAANIIAGTSALAANPVTSATFSMEEGADYFTVRILSAISGTDLKSVAEDELTDADRSYLRQAGDRLSRAPTIIDDTPGLSLLELAERCSQIVSDARHADMPTLGIVLVDYVQLLRSGGEQKAPADEVSRAATGLKSLAENLDVPVVALPQLSRKVEERADRRPILSDLNPTLAEESDMVLFMSRDATSSRYTCAPLLSGLVITAAKHPSDWSGRIKL